MKRYQPPPVDWEAQWAMHVPQFKDGLLEVRVAGKIFKMKAGPGFGNLSHPTTCLMLEMMASLVADKVVFDLGTGSGILALAACALGARVVMADDIDPLAIQHAHANAGLNLFHIDFERRERVPEVTLLNMIWVEQKEALVAHPEISGVILTSGILQEQAKAYLEFATERGWKRIAQKEKEGWLAFLFEIGA